MDDDSAQLTEEKKAKREAENGVLQFDRVIDFVEYGIQASPAPRIRPAFICELQKIAVQGIEATAGAFRSGSVEIGHSRHTPPEAHLVPSLVEEFCDYIAQNWESSTALHLSAYVLWRLNWIHPFIDGNGRTARALSYAVLCLKLGYVLPGRRTIPDMLADNKQPYYAALELVDESVRAGQMDMEPMENLLSALLAGQLLDVMRDAGKSV